MVYHWHMSPSTCVRNSQESFHYPIILNVYLLVSISVAIIVPSIVIAFNLQNMEDLLLEYRKRRKAKQAGLSPGGGGSSSAGQSIIGIPLEPLEAEGGRKQKVFDEELGRKSATSSY
jgi:hypothetical protein